MNPENQHLSALHLEEQNERFIDYPTLMNSAQVSAARKLDIEGSLDTPFFDSILAGRTEEEKEHILDAIGLHFDETLIDLVVAGLIGRKRHQTTILVADTEGISGFLPWQSKLQDRVELLNNSGLLFEVEVHIKRYTLDALAIESLSQRIHSPRPTDISKKHAA